MPSFKIVTRDYRRLHQRFVALGPGHAGRHRRPRREAERGRPVRRAGDDAGHGRRWTAAVLPSIREAEQAADVILHLAPETNGEIACDGYRYLEKRTGLKLTDLAEGARAARMTYKDLQAQPRRLLNSPCWSGLVDERARLLGLHDAGRAAPAVAHAHRPAAPLPRPPGLHRLRRAPARPTSRCRCPPQYGDLRESIEDGAPPELPDAARQVAHPLDLLRQPPDADAVARHRAALDERPGRREDRDRGQRLGRGPQRPRRRRARGPWSPPAFRAGICIQYHSPERTIGVPKSPLRGGRRAGGHNSLTRIAAEAGPDGRRLRAVHLPLQLLGPHRVSTATPRCGSASCREGRSC